MSFGLVFSFLKCSEQYEVDIENMKYISSFIFFVPNPLGEYMDNYLRLCHRKESTSRNDVMYDDDEGNRHTL